MKSYTEKQKQSIEALQNDALGTFQNPATKLPASFIPEVMPTKTERQPAISIIKEVNVPIIAVSLQNFFNRVRETPLLTQARKVGLKDFFNYSGEIILTTDVNDRLCDKFIENVHYFRTIVENLKPDYFTTFDTYTYSNVPACIARIKMQQALHSSNKLLDSESKVIGLSLGATPDQIYHYVEELKKMGCRIIAYPVYEFRRKNDTYSIRWRTFLSRKLDVKTLLLSCSPGASAPRKVYADYYSTYSWFTSINSTDPNVYKKRKRKLIRMIELGNKYSKQTCLGV
jgi:hypothetical protein